MTRTKDDRHVQRFRRAVLVHFKKHARTFPWRETTDPYRILVSEVMLQQTQTARVVECYNRFLKRFPTVRALAKASLADVYRTWAGLGYNRRAKFLRDAAIAIRERHGGKVPRDYEELRKFPGIGPYTAAAIRAFAWNLPGVFLETNIRTAFIHHFFKDREKVSDKELLPLAAAALLLCETRVSHKLFSSRVENKSGTSGTSNTVRAWYSALMDYGAHLKERGIRTHRQSRHYTRQSKFAGSVRQARGALLRALISRGGTSRKFTKNELSRIVGQQTNAALAALLRDGLIEKKGNHYRVSR